MKNGMSKTAKLILVGLLIVENGYMLLRWMQEASQTNDVGRQWIRIIIPGIMIIQSFATFVFVWLADKIAGSRKERKIEMSVSRYPPPSGVIGNTHS